MQDKSTLEMAGPGCTVQGTVLQASTLVSNGHRTPEDPIAGWKSTL
jgi:hypothetical protein